MGFLSSLFGKKESVTTDIKNIPGVSNVGAGRLEVNMDQFMDGMRESFASMRNNMQGPPPPAEDKRVPICPNCNHALDKIPERKKKCPHCGKQIYTYAKEVSPGEWERHLTREEEGVAYYAAIEEEKKQYQEFVESGGYKKARIDEIVANGEVCEITLSGGGCEKCMSYNRTMSPSEAYAHSPTCSECGYGYTVTGRVISF